MSRVLLRARRASSDTICAAVSVYLVLGILWVHLYRLLLAGDPTCIAGMPEEQGPQAVTVLYFSFVTLTTLGFGDVVPVSGAARGL